MKPVLWFKSLPGILAKSNGQCYDIVFAEMPGYEPLYAKPVEPLEGLRALRLHHWQNVLRLREYAEDYEMRGSDSKHYHKRADFHAAQVELLNQFFPIGDTAEVDSGRIL